MEHHFNVELATAFGIEKAVIINNLYFWIDHNAKNKTHIHDGNVWTYNSSSAFARLFPYIKERTLARYLIELEDKNILISGNYNTNAFDKTKWYAFSIPFTYELQNWGYDIEDILSCQNTQIDTQKMANRVADSGEPIPYNKHTDSKQKEEIDKSISKKDELFEECWKSYRRKGSKAKSKTYWNKLSNEERKRVLQHIKSYVSVRDLSYQKDFERYLRDKIFDTVIVNGNQIVYDPNCETDLEYHPYGNTSIMWNEQYKCYSYIGYFDGTLCDGYTDDNRPDGAFVRLNNARGTITWSKDEKKWIHKK